MKKAIFASGCFWGPEEKLSKIKGITKAEVGYCGGNNSKTSYKEVCTGQTNHAEVVKIEFDEKVITYDEIVNFFFKIHDVILLNLFWLKLKSSKQINFIFLKFSLLKTFFKYFLVNLSVNFKSIIK